MYDNAILPTVVHFLGAWMLSDSNQMAIINENMCIFFFRILKVFLDDQTETWKSQGILSFRDSGHPAIEILVKKKCLQHMHDNHAFSSI